MYVRGYVSHCACGVREQLTGVILSSDHVCGRYPLQMVRLTYLYVPLPHELAHLPLSDFLILSSLMHCLSVSMM